MAKDGVANGAAGVISLGLTVCKDLLKYYQSWKDSDDDVARTSKFLEQSIKSLQLLENVLEEDGLGDGFVDLVDEHIASCQSSIQRLKKRYDKITSTSNSGDYRDRIQLQQQRALYPFKESTLAKLREDLTDLGGNLTFALVLKMSGRVLVFHL